MLLRSGYDMFILQLTYSLLTFTYDSLHLYRCLPYKYLIWSILPFKYMMYSMTSYNFKQKLETQMETEKINKRRRKKAGCLNLSQADKERHVKGTGCVLPSRQKKMRIYWQSAPLTFLLQRLQSITEKHWTQHKHKLYKHNVSASAWLDSI